MVDRAGLDIAQGICHTPSGVSNTRSPTFPIGNLFSLLSISLSRDLPQPRVLPHPGRPSALHLRLPHQTGESAAQPRKKNSDLREKSAPPKKNLDLTQKFPIYPKWSFYAECAKDFFFRFRPLVHFHFFFLFFSPKTDQNHPSQPTQGGGRVARPPAHSPRDLQLVHQHFCILQKERGELEGTVNDTSFSHSLSILTLTMRHFYFRKKVF